MRMTLGRSRLERVERACQTPSTHKLENSQLIDDEKRGGRRERPLPPSSSNGRRCFSSGETTTSPPRGQPVEVIVHARMASSEMAHPSCALPLWLRAGKPPSPARSRRRPKTIVGPSGRRRFSMPSFS